MESKLEYKRELTGLGNIMFCKKETLYKMWSIYLLSHCKWSNHTAHNGISWLDKPMKECFCMYSNFPSDWFLSYLKTANQFSIYSRWLNTFLTDIISAFILHQSFSCLKEILVFNYLQSVCFRNLQQMFFVLQCCTQLSYLNFKFLS